MSIFQWDDAYNTGHAKTDAQHRQLVALLNQLEEAYIAGAPPDSLARILGEMKRASRQHLSEQTTAPCGNGSGQRLHDCLAALDGDADAAALLRQSTSALLAHLQGQNPPASSTASSLLLTHALQESAERLRILTETLPGLLWISFSDNDDTIFNQRWHKLRGDFRRRSNPTDWIRDIHPDDHATRESAREYAWQHQTGFQVRYRLQSPAGQYHWLQETGTPRQGADGQFVGFINYCVDISSQKNQDKIQQQALASHEQRYLELSHLFQIMQQLHEEPDTLTALQRISQLLPGCLRHPQHAAARIRYQEHTFASEHFQESTWRLHGPLLLEQRAIGHLELAYHTLPPGLDDDAPFSQDEQALFRRLQALINQSLANREERQQALLMHQEFELVMENAADAIFITDNQGKYLYVNPAACQLVGYAKPQLERMHLSLLCMDDDLENQLQAFRGLKRDGHLREELRLKRQDGQAVMVELNAVQLPDGHCFASCRDISERKQAELALRDSEERFRTIVEASGDGILVMDYQSLQLTFANQTLCEMLGYRLEQLIQLQLPSLTAEADLPRMLQCFRLTPNATQGFATEVPIRRANGSHFFADIKCRPIRFGHNQYLLGVLHDVTDRRESEHLLKRHLDILALLSGLSTELSSGAGDTLWQHIDTILERVGRFLGADDCFLLQPCHTGNLLQHTHHWPPRAKPAPPMPRDQLFPIEEQLVRNGILAAPDLAQLPADSPLHALLAAPATRSLLLAPLRQGPELRGIIGVATRSGVRQWLWMESRMLQSVADILTNAIDKYKHHQELSEGRRRLLEAQRIARIGNWEWDTVNNSLFWSDQTYAIFGLQPEQTRPSHRQLMQLVHPQDQPLVKETIRQSLKDNSPFAIEFRIRAADGAERAVRMQAIAERGSGKRVVRMAGTVQDITSSKQLELRLRQSAAVYENTMEGVVITDSQLHILDINRAFTCITGYNHEEILGQTPRILHSGRHDQEFYRRMWEHISQHDHWQGEVWDRRKNGEVFPEWLTITVVRNDASEVTNYVGVFSDISQIKQSASDMEHLAHYDSLTGLPNRLLFRSRLDHAIQTAKRERRRVAVMFIDLDNFKQINDTRGHSVGDKLLMEVSERLQTCLRTNDTVSRIGGDEFLILLENQKADYPVIDVASKIISTCTQPFNCDGLDMMVTCSVGISLYPRDGIDAETLMRNADTAMYQAKSEGKGCFRFYTEELTRRAILRVHMEQELRMALERKELYLVFQPKYQLDNGALTGAEALLRWQHPTLGLVGPDAFIPLAEETGQIIPIGSWIIQRTCQIIRSWLDAGLSPGVISINVAGPQIHRAPIYQTLSRALSDYRIPPAMIDLEVTENFIMHNPEDSLKVLNNLRSLGVSLSIDDFGTGYSSLSYLKQLPIQTLKIDQSFVRGLPCNENDAAISLAIISLAHTMHLQLVAEGIENEAQRSFLVDAGCKFGQGYLYAKPMLETEFASLLKIGGVPIPYIG